MNLNERALHVVDQMASRACELNLQVVPVGRARVMDLGVTCHGGLGAGLLLARACTADLAEVQIVPGHVGDVAIPAVTVHVTHAVAACMASQYAGWQIKVGKYFAMGSGPMRAAAAKEQLFDDIGFVEKPPCAVGILESAQLPDEAVTVSIAESCGVRPEHVTLLVAPTCSIAGGVQVVARSVETALHKLHELRFDLRRIVGGFGVAPLPPLAGNDLAAIGRTNDAVLYGGEVTLMVTGDDESLEIAGQQLPSSASKDYGEPFAVLFDRYGHDFYKIDPMLFSPAAVCLQNLQTGRTHRFGATNHGLLSQSFFGP